MLCEQLSGAAAGADGGAGGFYNMGTGYSSPTGSIVLNDTGATLPDDGDADNEIADALTTATTVIPGAGVAVSALSDNQKKAIRFDPDILEGTATDLVAAFPALSETL